MQKRLLSISYFLSYFRLIKLLTDLMHTISSLPYGMSWWNFIAICMRLRNLKERRLRWYGHVERSSGAVKTAFHIQVEGKCGPGTPKIRWKQLTASKSAGPLPDSWLAACMADLTPDLQVYLSWGSIAKCFHTLRSLSVSCFHVILGLPGPCFPLTCMSQADLTAPSEHSRVHTSGAFSPSDWGPGPQCQAAQEAHLTWWWQCLVAWHCRSVWSLPCHSAADIGGLALSMAKSLWHEALHFTHKSWTYSHVSC